MNLAEFDKLTTAILMPVLGPEGFQFRKGTFLRCSPEGLCHAVVVDLDMKTKKSFRVMGGFDAVSLNRPGTSPAENGIFGAHYVTATGIGKKQFRFAAVDRATTERTLKQVASTLESEVLPWFELHKSAEQIVDVIEDEFPFIKGKLLFDAGHHVSARPHLEKHLEYLKKQPSSKEIADAINHTELMLRQCGAGVPKQSL